MSVDKSWLCTICHRSGTFVDESGDTWVEMGARMKVSGKVEER